MVRKSPRKPRKADIKAAADRAEKTAKGEPIEATKVAIDPIIATAEELRSKIGRPTKYKSEYAAVATALCKRGATDFDLAEEFKVSTSTIWRWSCSHEDFWIALHVNKNSFDDRVERALAQRAVGYTYHSEKVFNANGEVLRAETVEHIPADVGAAKFWLNNRRPDKWREAVQRVENGKPGDFDDMTPAELDEFLRAEAQDLLAEGKSVKGKGATRH